MVMEIIVGAIALVFAILTVFCILTLHDSRKTMKKADRVLGDMHKSLEQLSKSGLELIENANRLTLDIHKKSEALNVIFRHLHLMKPRAEDSYEKIGQIIEFVSGGVQLFSKLKDEIKHYVKSR